VRDVSEQCGWGCVSTRHVDDEVSGTAGATRQILADYESSEFATDGTVFNRF
jgi:hypothetical protein